jgi:6-phosphogluconolactonase
MAVSGGHTPWQMLRAFASENVPWKSVDLVQVDERIAPAGDPDRNLTHLRESLLEHSPLADEQIHAMPVEEAIRRPPPDRRHRPETHKIRPT